MSLKESLDHCLLYASNSALQYLLLFRLSNFCVGKPTAILNQEKLARFPFKYHLFLDRIKGVFIRSKLKKISSEHINM